ncbi:hypothetical protein AB6A40_005090 [Gnathostoma spinigerum]|uniref:Uncharacterized protein n=1 Tax=Gnathostoma spinigerum TaxID=75299 RepID=A0ABD6EFE2_9BILA
MVLIANTLKSSVFAVFDDVKRIKHLSIDKQAGPLLCGEKPQMMGIEPSNKWEGALFDGHFSSFEVDTLMKFHRIDRAYRNINIVIRVKFLGNFTKLLNNFSVKLKRENPFESCLCTLKDAIAWPYLLMVIFLDNDRSNWETTEDLL